MELHGPVATRTGRCHRHNLTCFLLMRVSLGGHTRRGAEDPQRSGSRLRGLRLRDTAGLRLKILFESLEIFTVLLVWLLAECLRRLALGRCSTVSRGRLGRTRGRLGTLCRAVRGLQELLL